MFFYSLMLCLFNGSFSAEWAVQPPANYMAAIPDEASSSAISLCERIVAKINEIKKSSLYHTERPRSSKSKMLSSIDYLLPYLQSFWINVMKCGRIPRHIAVIMDGNRRYAKKQGVRTSLGHAKGVDKMISVAKLILELGVPEVTVYAFSIDNFKRSEEEVSALMNLFRQKFSKILDNIDNINECGIRFKAAGRLSLLPEDLQVIIAKIMIATRNNNKLKVNVACAYTARDEITRAASYLINSVKNGKISSHDIDEESVSQTLELQTPDLLIRTSGEVRLSDFMLWQISNTVLYFTKVLWPEFGIFDLMFAIIHFQRHVSSPVPRRQIRQHGFMKNMKRERWRAIEKTAGL